jgi:hypothetical protein
MIPADGSAALIVTQASPANYTIGGADLRRVSTAGARPFALRGLREGGRLAQATKAVNGCLSAQGWRLWATKHKKAGRENGTYSTESGTPGKAPAGRESGTPIYIYG